MSDTTKALWAGTIFSLALLASPIAQDPVSLAVAQVIGLWVVSMWLLDKLAL